MSGSVRVYLDNSATTRPDERVIQAMSRAMAERYFNPSSLYAQSLDVERSMDSCRKSILSSLKASNGSIVFTSGGTEADNLAILGAMGSFSSGKVLYSAGEHPAVTESCKALSRRGFTAEEIPLTREGIVSLEALDSMLTSDTRLICLMQVNNETGAVQPLRELAALRDRLCPEAMIHADGVQGFLRQACPVSETGIDSYALSAHKIHGPKGIGALWVSGRQRLGPILFGGGQEGALRSGTENTPGIAGLLAAIGCYPMEHRMRAMKLRLYERVKSGIPEAHVNGPDPYSEYAANHILNLSFPPVRAETMLHGLEGLGVLVGNGSACSSRKKKASHVLSAMRIPPMAIESAVRFSLNPYLTEDDIDYAADCVIKNFALLKRFTRR